MSHISNRTDRNAAKESPEAPEHEVQLLCHFTAHYARAINFDLRMYARNWFDFPRYAAENDRLCFDRPSPVVNETRPVQGAIIPLGMLEHLPQTVRYHIYNLTFPPEFGYFGFSKTIAS
ncbi:hypothetical protein F5B21DRAFT_476625 [Xylaria acuta]|nr:hypothetical protein F5B21DRAFT_476625 [Xylaria acuta]